MYEKVVHRILSEAGADFGAGAQPSEIEQAESALHVTLRGEYRFPFTVEELAHAFRFRGASQIGALVAATEYAESWRQQDPNREEGWAVYQPLSDLDWFLDPIASLSDDAARRVAEFRSQYPNKGN